jgi:cell pole-organizing protein PopZ
MDEILASIRRIIESNDPVPGVATGLAEPEGFSGNAANDDMEEVQLTIDEAFAPRQETFRSAMQQVFAAEMPEPEPERAAASREQDMAPQPKSLSLADVAARVRAASERNPGLRDLAPKAAEEEMAPMAAPTAAAVSSPEAPASSPLMTGRMAAAGGAMQAERPPIDWSDLAPRSEQRPPVEEQPVASEPAAQTSLISMDAGQQVARSFQDLAVAIDEAERRSYDDIAADLLRPMLQEWLDENLPTLVERLVREEIERVARGNRR